MSEWRDIGSAPKDGREVLVVYAGDRVVTARRGEYDGVWRLSCDDKYVDVGGEMIELVEIHPTHWQPLPLPPA
jgi:hypothetical protein